MDDSDENQEPGEFDEDESPQMLEQVAEARRGRKVAEDNGLH